MAERLAASQEGLSAMELVEARRHIITDMRVGKSTLETNRSNRRVERRSGRMYWRG
jgi:hypothetical protein